MKENTKINRLKMDLNVGISCKERKITDNCAEVIKNEKNEGDPVKVSPLNMKHIISLANISLYGFVVLHIVLYCFSCKTSHEYRHE